MLQNSFRKELEVIQVAIDEQMTKIDKLLQRLSQKQKQSLKKSRKQPVKLQARWSDQEQNQNMIQHRLNETRQETQYNNSRMNLSYEFQYIWEDCQEMLLDDYNQYDSRYIKGVFLNQPKRMTVLTKSNWINNYLDEDDSKVMFELDNQIKIIKDIAKGYVKYEQFDQSEESTQKFIESQTIYGLPSLQIEFPQHMRGYELNLKVGSREVIYQLTMNERGRILIECPKQQHKLIRFLVIKAQNEQRDIIWGAYSYQNILQSLILQAGKYILMPLPAGNTCNLYFQNSSSFFLKKDDVHLLKSFNLLKKSFKECIQFNVQSMTFIRSDQEDIQKQFMRSCYMNFGIVLEIYQNIYEHQARFVHQEVSKEDIQLLFNELYTAQQVDNRFFPGQRCIKFYIITQKPANLFIPNKKVLMGNRYMQNEIYHAIFK